MAHHLTLNDVPQQTRPNPVGEVVGGNSTFVSRQSLQRPQAFMNNTIFVNMGFSIGVKSEEALPANAGRTYLLIQNNGAGTIQISFGNKADGFNSVEIASGGNYEPWVIPSSSINVKASAANSRVVIVEGYGAQVE